MQMQSTYWLWKVMKMILYVNALLCTLHHIVIHAMQLRIDTAELHRVYDNMLQRAQKRTDVQDHFQHLL